MITVGTPGRFGYLSERGVVFIQAQDDYGPLVQLLYTFRFALGQSTDIRSVMRNMDKGVNILVTLS